MDKSFQVFDFHRIFIGDLPIYYLFEVIFRTLILYTYTIILLRILGKRGMGQISTLEVAIIISFGSAVGDSMIDPGIPIIYAMVAITAVTFFQIQMERLINKNKKVEAFMEGTPRLMVDNGVIMWPCMIHENLSREDLFRALRIKEVEHLGEVHKALFEISGDLSVMFYPPKKVRPGLSVLPENNLPESAVLNITATVPSSGHHSCMNCGYTVNYKENDSFQKCKRCGSEEWIRSVQ